MRLKRSLPANAALITCVNEAAPAAAPPPAVPEPAPTPAADAPKALPLVLAAEDNRTNQIVFKKLLRDAQVEMLMTENGSQLLEAYQAQRQ